VWKYKPLEKSKKGTILKKGTTAKKRHYGEKKAPIERFFAKKT
jgi:hypothetical protein